jgi:MFS superfamily sulfate permease-like transporter
MADIVSQMSTGPEAALSLLIGQMINDLVYSDPHTTPPHPQLDAAAISLVTTFQVGIITLALGLLRLGFLDVVLSRALLRGFITAVGVVSGLLPILGRS